MQTNPNEQSGFSYTYSAREQAEVKRIREKYTPGAKEEDKMTRLRRLDAGVTQTAQAVALVFGLLGTLTLGFGMSLIMTDLALALGMDKTLSLPIGVAIGLVGGTLAALAYPIYTAILKAKRKKIAPEILRLTDELMQ